MRSTVLHLAKIAGMGPARIHAYGDRLLAVVNAR